MDHVRSASGDCDASPSSQPGPIDEIERVLFAPSAVEQCPATSASDDYRAIYANLLEDDRGETASHSPCQSPPVCLTRQPAAGASLSGTDGVAHAPVPRRPCVRRPNPTKTTYRDAPCPLNGRIYNPVRFRSRHDPFERGARTASRQGEYREFSGHADDVASTCDTFHVYIIDDVERKKGEVRVRSLSRNLVEDIVWDLPEWVNRNGRTVHGVPPTPTDEYEVRINPSHAGASLASVPAHHRTRVFLTVRNPPPPGPLVAFTVAPIPTPGEPAGSTAIDRVRRALDAANTPDTAAVVTTRGEPLDCLDPKRDLTNIGQEVSLAVPMRHMLAVRTVLVARGFLVRDDMFRERALHIGPMSPKLLQSEAAGLVDRCRANGVGEDEIVLSAEMPLRTYVIMRLAELGSERYNDAYLANPRFRNEFKDRGPAHLSGAQTEQLSDAFYWVHLAPEDRRVPKFEEVIRFYQQRGVEVRLNRPHVKSGASVGRTSESGALRSFKQHSMATHSVLQSRYKILAPSGQPQALRTVKPRTKTVSAAERNPAAAHIDRLAAEAARRAPEPLASSSSSSSSTSPSSATTARRLGNTGIARFLKTSVASSTRPTTPTTDESVPPPIACPKPVVVAPHVLGAAPCADAADGVDYDVRGVREAEGPASSVGGGAHGSTLACAPPPPLLSLMPGGATVAVKGEIDCGRLGADATGRSPRDYYCPIKDARPQVDVDQDQHAQGASDLLALRRRAIAFPDPVVVGAPPEGVTEAVLTWASVRDKVAQIEEVPAAQTSKQVRGARKREKTTKKRAKKSSTPARAAAPEKPRTGKRRRNGSVTQASAPAPPVVTPHVVDMATLVSLLPRQGESLVLPIVHLRPPEGASMLPGFGAPYVRLPCPPLGPYGSGPQRMLLQQLPVLVPPGGGALPFGSPTAAPLAVPVSTPLQATFQPDSRLAVPVAPRPMPAHVSTDASTAGRHVGSVAMIPTNDNGHGDDRGNDDDANVAGRMDSDKETRQQHWPLDAQPVGLGVHRDSADWLNLLSLADSDRLH
nr:hypothetical protein [Pandoravirus belohorizontensis]